MRALENKSSKTLEHIKKIDLDLANLSLSDVFIEDNKNPGTVRIGKMDENFKKLLAEFANEVTPTSSKISIEKFKLNKSSIDATILSALGNNIEFCTLWEIAALLKLQTKGESGVLEIASDAIPHMFYVKDKKGDIWVVRLRFRTMRKAWNIELRPINDGLPWSGRNRYFYTKST